MRKPPLFFLATLATFMSGCGDDTSSQIPGGSSGDTGGNSGDLLTTGANTTNPATGSTSNPGTSSVGGDTTSSGSESGTSNTTDATTGGAAFACEAIELGAPATISGTNEAAGDDSSGSCSSGRGGLDVAYEWTAPGAGVYRIDTFGSTLEDTVLYVYDACEDGAEIACNDDAPTADRSQLYRSEVFVELTAGQTIAIVVDAYASRYFGEFQLHINPVVCAATLLEGELPINQSGSNVEAMDALQGSCGGAGGPDVAYQWSAPQAGLYLFDNEGTVPDTALYAYVGACGDPSAERSCKADGAPLYLALAAGEEVEIVIDGLAVDDQGDIALQIDRMEIGGACCEADGTGGCEDADVTACVCGEMPECCSGEWTAQCAGAAGAICGADCGTTSTYGPCEAMGTECAAPWESAIEIVSGYCYCAPRCGPYGTGQCPPPSSGAATAACDLPVVGNPADWCLLYCDPTEELPCPDGATCVADNFGDNVCAYGLGKG